MATKTLVLKNAFAQFIGKILTVTASFIVVKIVASFGSDFYGNYLTSYEYLAFFGIIADAGLFAIAVREMAKEKKQAHHTPEFILGNTLSMRLILILAVTCLAGISAQFIPSYPPMVKAGIWITGCSMALTIIAGTLSSILQARMKIQYFSGALVVGKIILALLIFFISTHHNIFPHLFFAMLWAGVASNIIFCALVTFFVQKEVKIRLNFNFDWWKSTLQKALPYGLALILQTLYLRLDIILISIILGASATGIYGIAARILESFLIIGVFFGQAILPKISKEEHDAKAISCTVGWGIEKLLTFALPIMIGTFFFAPTVIEILSSTEFLSTETLLGSDRLLIILIPTVLFAFLNQLFTFTLVAANRQKYLLKVNAIALGLNALLNICFLPKYGLIAAALSTIGCEALVLTLLAKEIYTHFPPRFNSKVLLSLLIAGIALFSIIQFTLLKEHLIAAVVVGGGVYLGIVWRGQKIDSKKK